MRRTNSERLRAKIFGILALLLISVLPASARQDFDLQKVTDDVYAVIRREPPSLWFNPNTVFIVGQNDVIVIDSNISSEYTRQVLAEIRKITSKPVRYVINTHWHEDHIIGNHVYRDAFPQAQFIGHESTLTDLPTIGASNRKGTLENGAGFVKLLKDSIEKGENLARLRLSDEEKLGYQSDIRIVESYLAEAPNFQIVLPTKTVADRLELNDGKRKIEIRFLGRAHTGGDLVVHLPQEKILISGDLLVFPVPLVGSTSYPLEYGATLEKLSQFKVKTIIPGHGPVMRDDAYLKLMIRLLNSIKAQTEAAFGRGETLEQMRKSVDLEEFRKLFAGDSQHKSLIFQNYVFLPATAAAHRQLTEKK